jgi:hypothetical protein
MTGRNSCDGSLFVRKGLIDESTQDLSHGLMSAARQIDERRRPLGGQEKGDFHNFVVAIGAEK